MTSLIFIIFLVIIILCLLYNIYLYQEVIDKKKIAEEKYLKYLKEINEVSEILKRKNHY